jgi:ADP-heptose:LPS heptosyltransferase
MAQRILVVELFEMGAAVMLRPSLRYLLEQNPKAEIHVLTTSMCDAIWRELDEVDAKNVHVITAASAFGFLKSAATTLLGLRKTPFDLVLDFGLFMRIPALLSAGVRTQRRAGFYKYGLEGLERGGFYTTVCAFNQNTHISKNYLALTRAAFENAGEVPNYKGAIKESDVVLPPSGRFALAERPYKMPYIVISPDVGPNLSVRNYPLDKMLEVARGLTENYPRHSLVFIGTTQNLGTVGADVAGAQLLAMGVNLMGQTDFKKLLSVIAGADLLVCNDNGPAHFATLTGTKTLALFSTDSPYVYGPLGETLIAYTHFQCSPCISAFNHKSTSCSNNLCLKTLQPTAVIHLACQLLNGTARVRTINNQISYLPSPLVKATAALLASQRDAQ